jgi:hypothetical protein
MVNEKRLIDVNALELPNYGNLEHPDPFTEGFRQGKFDAVLEIMTLAPTVDAVEVVRCKDCKHFCSFYNECAEPHNHYTEEGFREVYDNDFCSYGERKDNES